MSRLRERQSDKLAARRAARRRLREADQATESDALAAEWNGDYALLAFLFAMPDELAMTMLDDRRPYFDIRTGEHWDLVLPRLLFLRYSRAGRSGRVC